jgi:hypothetical protein
MGIDDWNPNEFVVVHSSWSPRRAADYVVRREAAPYVVVVDREDPTSLRYYVLNREEALTKLTMPSKTARVALDLDQTVTPAPALSTYIKMFEVSVPHVVVTPRGLSGVIGAKLEKRPGLEVVVRGGKQPSVSLRNPPAAYRGGAGTAKSVPTTSPVVPVAPTTPSSTTTPDTEVLSRYLGAELPGSIAEGDTVSLLVNLRSTSATNDSAPLALKAGSVIDVVVSPLAGLTVIGAAEGHVEVAEPQPDLPFRVQLRAERLGETGAKVYAFHAGLALASLTVRTHVVARAAAVPSPKSEETARVTVAPHAEPDLSLFIFEESGDLTFRLSGKGFHLKKFGPTHLKTKPSDYFRSFFHGIENLSLTTPEELKAATRKLRSKGAALFEALFPPDLKLLLWQLRDRIRSVQITSDEPWVPWEVCLLVGTENGVPVEGDFFAGAFEVTRWLYGAAAPARIKLDNIALVVPGDSGLASALAERDFVKSLGGKARAVTEIPANFLAVTDAMTGGKYDAWHFTGHGRADVAANADYDVIELTNREVLTPEDVTGEVERMLSPRPLVFLNACQTSQGGMSLASIGGWAQRFILPGASGTTAAAFIGSYWSVIDQGALLFAKEFYSALTKGGTVGGAAKDARAAVRQTGDPTWLAYTVYADPNATLET